MIRGDSQEKPDVTPPFQLGIVDQEQDAYTELLLRYFKENDAFSAYVGIQVGEEEEIGRLFEEGKLDGWLLLPDGFVSGMIQIEHVPLQVTLSLADTTKAVLLQNLFQVYGYYVEAVEGGCMTLYRQMEAAGAEEELLERANWQISLDLILAVLGREEFFRYEEQTDRQAASLFIYYGFSLLGIFPLLAAIPGGVIILQEKQQGLLARIRVTRGGTRQWFGSKLFLYGGLSFLIIAVISFFLTREIGREMNPGTWLLALGLCMGMVLLMLSAALFASDRRGYLLFAGMLTLFLAMAGGCFLPVTFLPDTVEKAAEWMPNRMLASILMGE